MPWTYRQSTGQLLDPLGHQACVGYSGAGLRPADGRNNPAMEADAAKGPIPHGLWSIGAPYDSPHTGPFSMPLLPIGHDAHGRSLFRIHGDNRAHNASHGCVILDRAHREAIWASHDHQLLVTA